MTNSSITALRQGILPDCRRRSVTDLLCLLRLEYYRLLQFEIRKTRQWHWRKEFMSIPRKDMTPSAAVLPSYSPPPQSRIPIASQYTEHQITTPAVSSLGACPTPAR